MDASKRRRRLVAFYVSIVIVCFGISMFLNSIATKLMPPSLTVKALQCNLREQTADVGGLLRYLFAATVDPAYVLAMGRSVALIGLLGVVFAYERHKRQKQQQGQPGGAAALAPAPPRSPDIVDRRLLYPVLIGIFNVLAYGCYICLCGMSGVAIWSAMVGCYSVLPVSYGLWKGESRTPKKLFGIACCVVGAVLLALAGTGEAPASADGATTGDTGENHEGINVDGPWWLKLGLYTGTIVFFSISDGISSYILQPPKAATPTGAAAAAVAHADTSASSDSSSGKGGFEPCSSGGALGAAHVVGGDRLALATAVGGAAGQVDTRPIASGWDDTVAVASAVGDTPPTRVSVPLAPAGAPSTAPAVDVAAGGASQGPPPPRPLAITVIIAGAAVGFAVAAAALGGVSMLFSTTIRPPTGCDLGPPAPSSEVARGQFVMFIAQVIGKVAWFSMVKVGGIGEASTFIPLIALDVFIPSLLGIIVLQEHIGNLGYAGMVLAAIGVGFISTAA